MRISRLLAQSSSRVGRMVPGWEVSAERVAQVVEEAVRTIAARYEATGPGPSTND